MAAFFAAVVIAALAGGCATSNENASRRIAVFFAATQLASRNTIDSFENVNRRHAELTVARAVASSDWQKLNASSIAPYFTPEQIAVRRIALDGLEQYASSLSSMMGNQQLDALDTATSGLGEALKGVTEQTVRLNLVPANMVNDTEIRAVATALNTIGHWLVEKRRRKAVRETAAEMHPHVANLANLIAKDQHVLRRNLGKTYDELVMARKVFIQHNEQRFDAVQRRSEIQAVATLLQEQRTADAAFVSMESSLAALVDAHRQLPTAFDLHAVSLDQRLRDLAAEGQRIKKYYDSLNK